MSNFPKSCDPLSLSYITNIIHLKLNKTLLYDEIKICIEQVAEILKGLNFITIIYEYENSNSPSYLCQSNLMKLSKKNKYKLKSQRRISTI